MAGLLLTSGAVVVLKDWVRYKRHKALLELAARLIETIKNQKGDLYKWKKEATDTLSAMKN
ncbi:MAG: hypothetical protein ACE5D7_02310 [Fidelibacterota bacterium]